MLLYMSNGLIGALTGGAIGACNSKIITLLYTDQMLEQANLTAIIGLTTAWGVICGIPCGVIGGKITNNWTSGATSGAIVGGAIGGLIGGSGAAYIVKDRMPTI